MDLHDLTRELHVKNDTKIVMLVADGLGGLPMQAGGKTELESASTPHLDALAARGVQGGSIPVAPGITPPIRCNFCMLAPAGRIVDRRAGRIPTEESTPLVEKLRQVRIEGVQVFVA